MQVILGLILLSSGLYLSQYETRPFIDYDFHLTWLGFLLLSDKLALRLSGYSIFSNLRNLFLLVIVSSFFWWFYEWANLFLQNWAYPTKELYEQTEWGILATAAFTTVLPHLVISTNIISGVLKGNSTFLKDKISKALAMIFVGLGILFFVLVLTIPDYTFPLVWLVIFLVIDPINALNGKRSLLVQIMKNNWRPLVILGIASLYAGFWWETINMVVSKWAYPIVPWFWDLPAPITTKYAEMPLAGFLGYVPFIYSAFAFVEFLQIKIPWVARD